MNDNLHSLGCIRDKRDKRDYRIAGVLAPVKRDKTITKFIIPDEFPVKNQKNRGSCTSQAQTHHKECHEGLPLAARFVMALTKQLEGNINYGAHTRNTFKIIQKRGVCPESEYPEPGSSMSWNEYIDCKKIPARCFALAAKHKSKSYWRVSKNLDEIKSVLMSTKTSIVCSMAWYKEFNRPFSGLLPPFYTNYVGGHAISLIGFDDTKSCLIFKNSFGKEWGDNGRFYMHYSEMPNLVWDMFCSLDIEKDMPVDQYYGIKRTWKDYLFERKIAFSPWLIKKIKRLPTNREITALRFYWPYEAVFEGKNGDVWLKYTYPEAKKKGLV